MTPVTPPEPKMLEDRYPCDLCRVYRKKLPRNYGNDFIDGYWACSDCRGFYHTRLVPGQRRRRRAAA